MNKLTIENLPGECVLYRNFSGNPTKYNAAGGKRDFAVILDPEYAAELENEGWHIRYTKPRDDEEVGRPYLKVSVKYGGKRPPKIVLVTSKKQTRLDEDLVHMLDLVDRSDISNIDMRVRPYVWDETGKYGAAAYVEVLYMTVADDDLEAKYSDVPEDDCEDVPFT